MWEKMDEEDARVAAKQTEWLLGKVKEHLAQNTATEAKLACRIRELRANKDWFGSFKSYLSHAHKKRAALVRGWSEAGVCSLCWVLLKLQPLQVRFTCSESTYSMSLN